MFNHIHSIFLAKHMNQMNHLYIPHNGSTWINKMRIIGKKQLKIVNNCIQQSFQIDPSRHLICIVAVSSSSQFALMSRFILLIVSKRALEKSSTLMYNLLRKVIGCVIRFALSKVKLQRIASSTLDGLGCYFFLLWLSMYDNAANMTSRSVSTLSKLIGHHPPL